MREQIGGLFWLAISIFVCIESYKSDIGYVHTPGPGFLPFWSAVVLGLFALAVIIYGSIKRQANAHLRDLWKGLNWGKVVCILCLLFIYPLALPKFGYIITTFVLVILVTSIMEFSRIWRHGVGAGLIVASSYLLFHVLLDVKLPKGMFGF